MEVDRAHCTRHREKLRFLTNWNGKSRFSRLKYITLTGAKFYEKIKQCACAVSSVVFVVVVAGVRRGHRYSIDAFLESPNQSLVHRYAERSCLKFTPPLDILDTGIIISVSLIAFAEVWFGDWSKCFPFQVKFLWKKICKKFTWRKSEIERKKNCANSSWTGVANCITLSTESRNLPHQLGIINLKKERNEFNVSLSSAMIFFFHFSHLFRMAWNADESRRSD